MRADWRTIRLIGGLCLVACAGSARASQPSGPPISFRNEVAPILLNSCQTCHGPQKARGKFRVDSFQRLLRPGKSKSAPLTPQKPQESEIVRRITMSDEDERMPQKADPLPAAQIEVIRNWVEQGALFDGDDPAAPLASLVPSQENQASPEVYPRPVPITAIAFSPDGKELAVSGYHEVTLWNPQDGKLLGRIGGLAERTWGLAYSPDGKVLAVAGGAPGKSGELRLCDPAGPSPGKLLDRIADMMLVVRLSPDGKTLAAGGADSSIRIYDVSSSSRRRLIEQHADWVTDLSFSPDGSRLASASRDKSARIFDVETGQMQAAYLGHEEQVLAVAWSDDGKHVYSAGRDRKVHVWSAADAKPLGQLAGFGSDPLKLETNGGLLFSCSSDGIVREYSQETRQLVRAFPRASDWTYCLSVDAKTRQVAAGCYNGEVRIYNAESGRLLSAYVAAPGHVR